MTSDRTGKTAERYNIVNELSKLQRELLDIEDVAAVRFDLDGFYDNIHQIIFTAEYDIPVSAENYYERRGQLIKEIVKVANNNSLVKTEDTIEDYGTAFYFVFKCKTDWIKVNNTT